jgi:cell division protein FtsB
MRKRIHKKKIFNQHKFVFYMAFWVFVTGIFASVVLIQRSKTIAYHGQIEALRNELSAYAASADAIRQEQQDLYNPENVEKRARELLGLVYPDEIIF